MQLTAFRLILALVAGLFPAPSRACTLALGSGGTLDMSMDGTVLGSGEGAGAPVSITLVTGLFDDVTISAPGLVSAPADYRSSGQVLQVAYHGTGLLSGVVQSYTVNQTQFSPGILPLTVLSIHSRIINTNGFAAGDYQARVVVTCS